MEFAKSGLNVFIGKDRVLDVEDKILFDIIQPYEERFIHLMTIKVKILIFTKLETNIPK